MSYQCDVTLCQDSLACLTPICHVDAGVPMNTTVSIDERAASPMLSVESHSWRTRLMHFVDEPKSSTGAQIFAWMSVFFVIVSIIGLQTVLRYPKTLSCADLMLGTVPHYRTYCSDWIIIIEACCVAWFSLELALRTISERSIKRCYTSFSLATVYKHSDRCLKSSMNIIDLVGIMPFYVDVIGWLYTGDKTLLLDNPDNEVTSVKNQFKGAFPHAFT